MKRLQGKKLPSDFLDEHHYVCDLVDAGFPILCLWTDGRANWIYQWCDSSDVGRERWLLFRVGRAELIAYLREQVSQLDLIRNSPALWMLDISAATADESRSSRSGPRRTLIQVALGQVEEYLPSSDSMFDPGLTSDLDLTKELAPSAYALPIDGVWFSLDFQDLFRRYQRLYAFFYATGDRFVKTVENTLDRVLRAPFRGGYSRINLYTQLGSSLPAVHALKVNSLQFASPGDIVFEAIPSIGTSINTALDCYIANEDALLELA